MDCPKCQEQFGSVKGYSGRCPKCNAEYVWLRDEDGDGHLFVEWEQ